MSAERIKSWPTKERPRERLLAEGPERLTDADVLAIILRIGSGTFREGVPGTDAKQRFEPGKANRGLTDEEIASRLGLTIEEVIEIRCVAENEKISLEAHLDADDTKEKRFSRPARSPT